MANQDRSERYSKIRAWLDFPYAQKPNPHQIVNQMFATEQAMNLRLTNTRQPWNLISETVTTVADTGTYAITQPVDAFQNSGKVYFVVRATEDENAPFLPVPFDDFSDQDFGMMPTSVNSSMTVPEKISFYRSNMQGQAINAVIQPVPQEVLEYTVWFFAGAVDRSQALMTGTGPVTELSDYLDIKTAWPLLPYSEWDDDETINKEKRITLAAGFALQLGDINRKGDLEHTVDHYIKNINHQKSFDMDHWDE